MPVLKKPAMAVMQQVAWSCLITVHVRGQSSPTAPIRGHRVQLIRDLVVRYEIDCARQRCLARTSMAGRCCRGDAGTNDQRAGQQHQREDPREKLQSSRTPCEDGGEQHQGGKLLCSIRVRREIREPPRPRGAAPFRDIPCCARYAAAGGPINFPKQEVSACVWSVGVCRKRWP